jgi:hypothetical protein
MASQSASLRTLTEGDHQECTERIKNVDSFKNTQLNSAKQEAALAREEVNSRV